MATAPVEANAAEADISANDCSKDHKAVDYTRKADLPPGVVDALGFPMAEAGEPFQATDVIRTPHLPFERFVSARRTGCALWLLYERGGIALRHEAVDLDLEKGKWTVRKPPAAKP